MCIVLQCWQICHLNTSLTPVKILIAAIEGQTGKVPVALKATYAESSKVYASIAAVSADPCLTCSSSTTSQQLLGVMALLRNNPAGDMPGA
jgi:hypothetical protein